MVEKREIVTLFKIERISEDFEQLIPFCIVEGVYDSENYTFTATDGTVYLHIEETEYPNFGYANKNLIHNCQDSQSDNVDNIEDIKKKKLENELKYKYIRFISQKEKIYQKSKDAPTSWVMTDPDSRKHKEEMEQLKEDAEQSPYEEINLTPKEIVEEVKKTIKGQDYAIQTISTCLWATLKDRKLTKKQMLLIGPTGCGKTAIFKKIQEILDIPVIIFSVPGLSQAGYIGRSTDEILKQVYFECNEDVNEAEKAIVILDEIDKLAYDKDGKSGDISTTGVQNELLKIVEGCKRLVEIDDVIGSFNIDTSNMIFIATGAFQELYEKKKLPIGFSQTETLAPEERHNITTEDLIKYGLKRELIGRFPIKVQLNALTKEIFREIILESDESELLSHVNFLKSLGVSIINLDDIINLIIDDAISKGIGARGLIETISKLFLNIIYEIANNPKKYCEVKIGTDILNNPKDFELIERKTKRRTKKKNN